MCKTTDIIYRIRSYAAHVEWSKTKLARKAGINTTTLRSFHSESWNPTIETLRQLEKIIPEHYEPEVESEIPSPATTLSA